MERYKILVVDDEEEIRSAVTELLEHENYEVVTTASGNQALEMIDDTFDLMILDVMMPDKDGISTCIDVRTKYVIPILFLTAKNTEYDKCVGLSVGGDDYLEKPFSKIELLARVSSLLRRYRVYQQKSPVKTDRWIQRKDLKIDQESTRVFKGENEIFLTNTEYKLLLLLAKNPNKIFTLEMIYEQAWQEKYEYSVNASVMVHIRNLRKKIGDTIPEGRYIKNIWGRGYCIEDEE